MKRNKSDIPFIAIVLLLFVIGGVCLAKQPEKYYQKKWCDLYGGQMEVVLDDKTRVDCLIRDYAIEFDFDQKWAESIGQALYYAIKTNRKPGVVLICGKYKASERHLLRLQTVASQYGIKVWTVEE